MRHLFFLLLIFVPVLVTAQEQEQLSEVILTTDSGNIKITLYNETPKHRDNFLKLIKEGFYDGLLFHRVIFGFMIQGGDPKSRNARPGELLGNGGENMESIPAEIIFPKYFHRRGCIAAAREGDSTNPERASSACQFYIVWGRRMNEQMMNDVQEQLDKATNGTVKLTPEIREAYYKYGGTPHLDGQYTVFGEITEGLDVIDKIQRAETDYNDRPVGDIRIIKAFVSKSR